MKSESGFCCMVVPARASLGILRHRPLIFNNSDNCFVFFSFGKILVATPSRSEWDIRFSVVWAGCNCRDYCPQGDRRRYPKFMPSPERTVVDPEVLASSAGGDR